MAALFLDYRREGAAGLLVIAGLLAAAAPALAQPPRPAEAAKRDAATVRAINETLAATWRKTGLKPSETVTDHEFVRRASLDVIGRIATPEEVRAFERDRRPDKRARLIDRLLDSPDYARHCAGLWTDWLLCGPGRDPEGERLLEGWLERQFAKNVSHKVLVEKLLTAAGKAGDNPAVLYALAHLGQRLPARDEAEFGQFDAAPLTGHAVRLFLGLRFDCLRCHDHPFEDEWRQPHFWRVNAFFRQLERRDGKGVAGAAGVELRDNPAFNKDGMVFFERISGIVVAARPAWLDGVRVKLAAGRVRREAFVERLTGDKRFARAWVNRLWGQLFGRGLHQQPDVDDFGEYNPPVHPELLDRLAAAFVASAHDPKALLRCVCNSDAYQLQSVPNAANASSDKEAFFSRMPRKVLSPRQRLESLLVALRADATLTAAQRDKLREHWRLAGHVPAVRDAHDGDLCVSHQPRPVPVFEMLRMMWYSEELGSALTHAKGTVAEALKAREAPRRLEALYLAAYNRRPTARETDRLLKRAGADAGRAAWWEDLYFAMLNSSEFLLNH